MFVREATREDADLLPIVESSAAQLFKAIPAFARIAQAEAMPLEKYQSFIAEGKVWVAEQAGELAGFIITKAHGQFLHIYELSVVMACQRQGIGSALLEKVYQYALDHDFIYLSLTTFTEIPWNAPFYSRLSFQVIPQDQLPAWLITILMREEAVFKENQRCAMNRKLVTRVFI